MLHSSLRIWVDDSRGFFSDFECLSNSPFESLKSSFQDGNAQGMPSALVPALGQPDIHCCQAKGRHAVGDTEVQTPRGGKLVQIVWTAA